MLPSRPMRFQAANMTIDDAMLLVSLNDTIDMEQLGELKRIIADCSDWTLEEVGKVTMGELQEVMAMIGQAQEVEAEQAVPFETASSSAIGPQVEVVTVSQSG